MWWFPACKWCVIFSICGAVSDDGELIVYVFCIGYHVFLLLDSGCFSSVVLFVYLLRIRCVDSCIIKLYGCHYTDRC
jgi:hypothetical protein